MLTVPATPKRFPVRYLGVRAFLITALFEPSIFPACAQPAVFRESTEKLTFVDEFNDKEARSIFESAKVVEGLTADIVRDSLYVGVTGTDGAYLVPCYKDIAEENRSAIANAVEFDLTASICASKDTGAFGVFWDFKDHGNYSVFIINKKKFKAGRFVNSRWSQQPWKTYSSINNGFNYLFVVRKRGKEIEFELNGKLLYTGTNLEFPGPFGLMGAWMTQPGDIWLDRIEMTAMPELADYNKGLQYLQSMEFSAALSHFRPLAEQKNDSRAQCDLGIMYFEGLGVKVDHEKAFELLEKSSAQDYANADLTLGKIYATGPEEYRDFQKAMEYFKKADSEPSFWSREAQYMVGSMYMEGMGVPKDFEQARTWFERAGADTDLFPHAGALYALGLLDMQVKNYSLAVKRWTRAATKGELQSLYALGYFYAQADPAIQDLREAYKWFVIAAKRYPAGEARNQMINGLQQIGSQLSEGQIKQAVLEADLWLREYPAN
jgi:TPR repeat protein